MSFYRETNSKSGKIYLLATMKYTSCAYLSPPFTDINQYNLKKKSCLILLPHLFTIFMTCFDDQVMLYHILARFNLQFIKLLHIIISVAWQAWHINSKMNQPPNYQEMGFFPSLHIYKNLPRITVFRKLKCPDPSMIPLPAEVKECSQKSIRLTSYILI